MPSRQSACPLAWRASFPPASADIACNLAQVSGRKVDGVLVCEEHVTGKPGHHHPAEGGGGQDGPRVELASSPSQQVEENDYMQHGHHKKALCLVVRTGFYEGGKGGFIASYGSNCICGYDIEQARACIFT